MRIVQARFGVSGRFARRAIGRHRLAPSVPPADEEQIRAHLVVRPSTPPLGFAASSHRSPDPRVHGELQADPAPVA